MELQTSENLTEATGYGDSLNGGCKKKVSNLHSRDEKYNVQIKNTMNGINSRFNVADEKTRELENIVIETTQNETKRKEK